MTGVIENVAISRLIGRTLLIFTSSYLCSDSSLSCLSSSDHESAEKLNYGPQRGKTKTEESINEANRIKSAISILLGGDQYLTTPFFERHLHESGGLNYWSSLRSAVNLSNQLHPSEERNNGLLPQYLQDKIISVTRSRLKNPLPSQLQYYISVSDLQKLNRNLREEIAKFQTSGE